MILRRTYKRRGHSLIEVLVVVTISSVLLTLLAQMLHRMLSQHLVSQHSVAFQRESSRLAYRFRNDLRRSTEATVIGDTLSIVQPQGDVTYTANERRLTIIDSIEGRLRREEFALPPGCRIAFEQNEEQRSIRMDLLAFDPTFQADTISGDAATPTRIVVRAFAGRRDAMRPSQDASTP